MIKLPLFLVNFKTYENSFGDRAMSIVKILEEESKRYSVQFAIAAPATEISNLSKHKVPVFAQHVDPIEPGAHTGWLLPEAVKSAGAIGSLINHSEHQVPLKQIKETVSRLKKLSMLSVVCVPDVKTAKKVAKFNPDFVAFEPPELVGGKYAVSEVEPDVVKKFSEAVRKVNPRVVPLCGAGIRDPEDVEAAISLGTQGVLVASCIMKSKNVKKTLKYMLRSFKK